MEKTDKLRVLRKIIIGLLLFIISILLLTAIIFDEILDYNYETLKKAELSFFEVIKLDFPNLHNPIGPFGVIFGYWTLRIFGLFFGISLLLNLLVIGGFLIIRKEDHKLFFRSACFLLFAFFTNIFLMNTRLRGLETSDISWTNGAIPKAVFVFFNNLFNFTGTAIISIVIIIAGIILIFGIEKIKNLLVSVLNLIKTIFGKKEETEPLKVRKPRIKREIPETTKKITPNITDHAVHKKEDDAENEYIKPILPKRKLTQDPDKTPDEVIKREYVKPDVETFLSVEQSEKRDLDETKENIKKVSSVLKQKLAEFNVDAEVINVNIGPIITQYEIEPAPGVKVSKFHSLSDDLSLAIKAKSIRVQAPIPGRGLVGIEIPNVVRDTIYFKDVFTSEEMTKSDSVLSIVLGKDISGNPIIADLTTMPHLLIAGSTGSGKSVCVNTLINSILFRATPDEVRLIMIDPKRIELSGYEGIPHLIQEVVTDNEDALAVLNWCVSEMERRYELLQKYKARNLLGYNKEVQRLKDGAEEDEVVEAEKLPFIVVIVDEFADLMMTIGRDVEFPITRLAQMARAIGIHLVLATQRPSMKVITGIIKANFPARIAFRVSSKIDSRVIIDMNGAEKLLGRGDMLFMPPGKGTTERIHGAFISDEEIKGLVDYLKTQPKPDQEIMIIADEDETGIADFDYDDELFPEAACAVVSAGSASVSMLQRHFKVGYARAGRLVDMLERSGIIGPHVGSKSREVLASEEDLKIYGYWKE